MKAALSLAGVTSEEPSAMLNTRQQTRETSELHSDLRVFRTSPVSSFLVKRKAAINVQHFPATSSQ